MVTCRLQVYYCTTLIRELDPSDVFTTKTVKDVPRQNGNDVAGLDKPKG